MSRRKAEAAFEQPSLSADNTSPQAADADQPAAQHEDTRIPDLAADTHAAGEQRKSTWISQFDSWGDHEAGVTVIEDRQNRLMTIKFGDKPSEAVRALLKAEPHSFRFDPENKVWYKRISQARPGQSRRETEELAFEAANIIRQEKGLELKKAFSLGM